MSKAKATAAKCEICHHQSKTGFCDNCHHGTKVDWKFDHEGRRGRRSTRRPSSRTASTGCLGEVPRRRSSARTATPSRSRCRPRTRPRLAARPEAGRVRRRRAEVGEAVRAHVASFQKSAASACAVCHGDGGTKSAFCKGCHKLDMPHPDEFTKFHSTTGKQQPGRVLELPPVQGAVQQLPPQGRVRRHAVARSARQVGQHGRHGSDCFAKCHKKDFCVNCHTSRKVVPASHNAGNWTARAPRRPEGAAHSDLYKKSPDPCTYCHGDGGAKAKFCPGCHKLDDAAPEQRSGRSRARRPRPTTAATTRPASRRTSSTARRAPTATTPYFCDTCHHKDGFKGKAPWGVAKVGTRRSIRPRSRPTAPQHCFECHKETYCSYCHVRAQQVAHRAAIQRSRRGPVRRSGRALLFASRPAAVRRAGRRIAPKALGSAPRRPCMIAARRDVAQLGRALRSGRRGRGFESRHPDHPTHRRQALGGLPFSVPGTAGTCSTALMHWLGYGLCHQLPERSFFGGGLPGAGLRARHRHLRRVRASRSSCSALLSRGRRPSELPAMAACSRSRSLFIAAMASTASRRYAGWRGPRRTTSGSPPVSWRATRCRVLLVPILNGQLWRRPGPGAGPGRRSATSRVAR